MAPPAKMRGRLENVIVPVTDARIARVSIQGPFEHVVQQCTEGADVQ